MSGELPELIPPKWRAYVRRSLDARPEGERELLDATAEAFL